jgi:hypothetical protein
MKALKMPVLPGRLLGFVYKLHLGNIFGLKEL